MGGTIATIADRIGALVVRLMLARYLLVSVAALSVDMALFLALAHMGVPASWAAFAGYALGILVHWTLAVRFVFAASVEGGPSHAQRVTFVMSALLGLAITVGLVGALTALGLAPALAKAASVGVSFVIVYLIRKYVVFGAR